MIIECPDCATRYDIKSQLPPEGRSVRCAKCGSVWRAMPEREVEELEAEEDFWTAPSGESEDTSHKAASVEDSHDPFAAVDGAGKHGAVPDGGSFDHSERSPGGQEPLFKPEAGEEPVPGEDGGVSRQGDGSGKIRWFLSFRRRKNSKNGGETDEEAQSQDQPAAEPIPFPRPNGPVERPAAETNEDQHTLDAARQAFQGVFSGGGGQRGHVMPAAKPAATFRSPLPEEEQEDAGSDGHNSWAKRWAEFSDRFKKDAATGQSSFDAAINRGAGAQDERPFHTMAKNVLPAEGEEIDDPDAALREAMRAHFHPRPERAPAAPSLPADDDLARKLETHLKSRAAAAEATVEAEDAEPD